MDASLFDYQLPESAIAQHPSDKRDHSRLLVVKRKTKELIHTRFEELPSFLPKRSLLFRNNASVFKARLPGERPTGGKVECFLLKPDQEYEWWCMLKPGKRLKPGNTFGLDGIYQATVRKKNEEGYALVKFKLNGSSSVLELSDQIGFVPLPPYIKRENQEKEDIQRYQTVYANPNQRVAVAAPTAGFHFSRNIIKKLESDSHRFIDLTLHIGLGTFKPIQSEKIENHEMHSEFYEIPQGALEVLHNRQADRPLTCIGTTAMRAIEDYSRNHFSKHANAPKGSFCADASLFIYPPNQFHIDHLLTNFHLPRSTLICLVSAFLCPGSTDGISWIKEIYQEAIDYNYRFYSYGDAMLIL